jgi:hypothetical protein
MEADNLGSVPGRGRSFCFRHVHTDYEVHVSSSQRVPEIISPEAERRKHEPMFYGTHPVACHLRKDIIWDSRTTNNQKETK